MAQRLFQIKARVGRWGVVELTVDAVDRVDALRRSWRELNDGKQKIVWLSCEALP